MLFDLRSKGRRRTVQVVYGTLALLMGGGLVFFGVGAGNGFGGLLDAFNNGGGGGSSAVTQQEKDALKQTRLHPDDPQAWASLFQARYTSAGQGSNFDPNVVNQATGQTGDYTASGKQELRSAGKAWQHYLTLTKTPSTDLAQLAARAYDITGDYADEAAAWQIVTAANPTQPTYFEYLAQAAYRAKDLHLGDLAASQAVALTPKAQQSIIKQQLQQAKSSATGTSTSATGTPAPSAGATTTTVPVAPAPAPKSKTKKP